MNYYPSVLPHINLDKIKKMKHKSTRTTMLYSDEGIFRIKQNQLDKLHYKDADHTEKRKLKGIEFVCDNSKTITTGVQKLPYTFERREFNEIRIEQGSVKMYIHESKGKVSHIWFYIHNQQIHNIEDDIIKLMEYAKS